MRRVVVLGCAGAGKSVFARRLAARLGAPAVCLDAIWRREWDAANVPAFRALIDEAHRGETWVSDGNFAQATFDIRLPRADLIVWLERPRWLCATRVVLRVFRSGEAHRLEDVAKVLRFIWGFERINRPRIEALIEQFGRHVPLVRLRTETEVERFVVEGA